MTLESAIPLRRLAPKPERPLSFFEFWPGWLFYTPVVMHWMLLGLRHGDFSPPTAANPHITTGGLCGESKLAILSQVGDSPRRSLIAQTLKDIYSSFTELASHQANRSA